MSLIKKEENTDMEHINSVCKIGQKENFCRYLVISPQGFECAKETSLKETLDSRIKNMNAKGDNCNGYSQFVKL